MSTINKSLLGIMFSGTELALADAGFKNNLRTVYGFNSAGTAYTSFKPTSLFNSLTKLVPDASYILDVATLGFELPGAVLTPTVAAVVKSAPVTGDNLLDPSDSEVLVDTYINENYLGTPTALAGWTASGFMPVVAGTSYGSNSNLTHSAFFDASKSFVRAYGDGVAPAGAAYLRISVQSGVFAGTMVILGGQVPGAYVAYWRTLVATSKPFSGKKIGLLGDSLTLQGTYISTLMSEIGASSYVQKGFSGEVFRTGTDLLPAGAFTGCDLILIAFGTNEYGHGGNTLGNFTDAVNVNTICGSVAYSYQKVREQYPAIPICFTTPTERGAFAGEPTSPTPNPYGLTIKLIGDAIKATCAVLGVPVVDLYTASNINSSTFSTTLQSDNLHWSAAGGAYVGTVIGKSLNAIYSK